MFARSLLNWDNRPNVERVAEKNKVRGPRTAQFPGQGGKHEQDKKQEAGRSQGESSPRRTRRPATRAYPHPPHRWTFLTNHAHVLTVLHADPQLVLREVAARVGITERAVQRIVQDLEDEGFIRREKVGRQNRYQVMTDQPLRHPIEAHRKIGDLLRLITGSHPDAFDESARPCRLMAMAKQRRGLYTVPLENCSGEFMTPTVYRVADAAACPTPCSFSPAGIGIYTSRRWVNAASAGVFFSPSSALRAPSPRGEKELKLNLASENPTSARLGKHLKQQFGTP